MSTYSTYYLAEYLVIISLSITAIASLSTLWKAFNVINPFLDQSNKAVEYQSKVSFLHVSEYAEPESYFDHFQKLTEELSNDLAKQAYSLSQGLKTKFENMKAAIRLIVWGQLFPLGIMIVTKLVIVTLNIFQKGVNQ